MFSRAEYSTITGVQNGNINFFSILPIPPSGSPNDLAQDGIVVFTTWLSRIGGIIAFIGAIKLALAIKDDHTREQTGAILMMVSGFMIITAVNDLSIFDIPATYSDAAAELEFQSIMDFIGKWARRVGAFGMFMGAVMLAFSMKDNDAAQKVIAIKSLASGGIVVAVSGILNTFV